MALSRNLILYLTAKVAEAEMILASPNSTESERTVARFVLSQWRVI